MRERKLDQFIRESLQNGTDQAVTVKEQIWANLQERLDEVDQRSVTTHVEHKKSSRVWQKRRIWITATIAVVFLGVFLMTTTEQGQAVIGQVRQWLEPKKSIELELEGTKEQTDVNLHQQESQTAQESDFVIYVDETRYYVVKENGVFRITLDLPERYPEVYMDITQQADVKPADAIEKLKQSIPEQFSDVGEIEQVNTPVKALYLRADQGNKQWDDEIIVYYVVSNGQNGSFIIKQKYFLEASEGHGVRFDNMLKEFKVVTKGKGLLAE